MMYVVSTNPDKGAGKLKQSRKERDWDRSCLIDVIKNDKRKDWMR